MMCLNCRKHCGGPGQLPGILRGMAAIHSLNIYAKFMHCSCSISIGGLYTFFVSDTDIVVFFTSHDIARRSHIAVSIYKVRHFLNNLIALKTIHLHLHVSVPTYGCKIQTVIPVVTI